ncbi:methylated-DNA--[protein]-cysteine S-methyltransferase [Isoptericola hypogeus]|uniref:Methylated-DNA--[protein]-cysteine S-methyltransferase n=1 Tax=Isoptericola hypogeus TaxID=300179 RepID=A0ABN2JR02_9MICO
MNRSSGLVAVVFPTSIGHCAMVWDPAVAAVVGSTLPQGGASAVRAAVRRWYPGAVETEPEPGGELAGAVEAVRELLDGGTRDLVDLPLDLTAAPEFDARVYGVVREIPPGNTLTYGEVAERLGMPGAAQAVGQALGRNPYPPIVPCHRVLAAGRRVGGFSARGGPRTKLRMLAAEGVHLEQPTLFDL